MHPVENELEHALRLAMDDPAARPDFYAALLEASVLAIGAVARSEDGRSPGGKARLQGWRADDGSGILPFFTSSLALERALVAFEASARMPEAAWRGAGHVQLPMRTFLGLIKGAAIILNPGSENAKRFGPEEVAMLASTGLGAAASQRSIAYDATTVLRQPRPYPAALVEVVSRFLFRRPAVQAAYIAQLVGPDRTERPHLLIGLELDGASERIFEELAVVMEDGLGANGPIDVIPMSPRDIGISASLRAAGGPFYKRRGSGWAALFRGGGR